MANEKISALTNGNPAQTSDAIPTDRVDVNGINVSVTASSIAALSGVNTGGSAAIATSLVGNGTNYVVQPTDDFYPEIYGAVGDNVHDDTVAIQSTINAAVANGGGTVRLRSTTYKTTSALTMTNGYNVNIKGVSAGSSIISCTSASSDILAITGPGHTSVGNLVYNVLQDFSLIRTQKPTGTAAGIRWTTSLWANVVRVNTRDNIYGFYQTQCGNINYQDCLVDNVLGGTYTGYGFYYEGTSGNQSSRNVDCLVANRGISTMYGLVISGAQIFDLFCEGFETASCTYGVSITATTHTGLAGYNGDIHFVRCILDQCASSGYLFTNVYGALPFISVVSGYVQMASGNGIAIDIENSSGITVTGMVINCCNGSTNTTPGVYINGSNSTNNIINGNQFYVVDSGCPIVLNNCSGNNIVNNAINGYSAAPFNVGIKGLSATYNIVANNNLSGYGSIGISYDSGSSHNGGLNAINPTNITTPISDSGTNDVVTIL